MGCNYRERIQQHEASVPSVTKRLLQAKVTGAHVARGSPWYCSKEDRRELSG